MHIKIEISAGIARFEYLNNELLFEVAAPTGPVTASVCKDLETRELILKMVNSSSSPVTTSINIKGPLISQYATVITLSGTATQRNSLPDPDLIVPVESTVPVYNSFEYTLPGNSLQVFRIKTDSLYQKIEETKAEQEEEQHKDCPQSGE